LKNNYFIFARYIVVVRYIFSRKYTHFDLGKWFHINSRSNIHQNYILHTCDAIDDDFQLTMRIYHRA